MKILISILLLSQYSIVVFCQNDNENRLISRLNHLNGKFVLESEETRQIDILLELAQIYQNYKIDSSLYYGNLSLKRSEEIGYIHGQVGALSFIAHGLIDMGNLPKAMELSLSALELGKNIPVRIGGIGAAFDNIGTIYFTIGDYSKALEYFKQEVNLGDNDKVGVAFANYNIAAVYEQVGKLDSAMLFLEKSFEAFRHINYLLYPNTYQVYPAWYNLRAQVYLKKSRLDLALNDLKTSLSMTLRNEEHTLTANTYNDLASLYRSINKQDSSILYAEKAMIYARKTVYSKGILNASSTLSKQWEEIDPSKALHYHKLESETRNSLYGAGNIQAIRDMIAQNENKLRELEAARIESRNRIRLNSLLGSLFTLLVVAILLFRNNRIKQKAKQKIESAFEQLKSTQSQLIQSEKMASLGELTAGIAHEIQNPLNFVNNFSEVSSELVDELQEELNMNNPDVVREISNDIKQNLDKINHHGQRASGIVKGMLEHSRTSDGKKELTDLNALADEYLRLAYHGLRAKDKSFNADFKTDFDASLPKVSVIPQDIGRVLLNLINNAFYAVDKKVKSGVEGYKPELIVSTNAIPLQGGVRGGSQSIQISIKDNGPGIPEEIKDKIFQPFFTTKPTGSGTGLGLSLSYDIVKAHGGETKVESEEGKRTEFIITLPII